MGFLWLVGLQIGQCSLSSFYTNSLVTLGFSQNKASVVGEDLVSFAMALSASNHPSGISRPGEEASSVSKRSLSCSTCFDALWFCYSPVHQMQQYYRLGTLDNCSGKWSSLVDCLTLKTKRSAEVQEILETREKAKLHIWTFRTAEEALSNWKEQFGHLDEME